MTRISTAVTFPIRSISSGSRAAPSPTLCGKIVAPTILLWPCTASVPPRSGWPVRRDRHPSRPRKASASASQSCAGARSSPQGRWCRVEHRAEPVAAHVFGRHAGDVGLDDLPDLLFERHPREDRLDARLARFGQHRGERHFGPAFRMDPCRRDAPPPRMRQRDPPLARRVQARPIRPPEVSSSKA